MSPLLEPGDYVIIDVLTYRGIQRGDVVAYWFPREPDYSFVKRVVGLPGDVVEFRNGSLYRNGIRATTGTATDGKGYENEPAHRVWRGHFYVLSDNPSGSDDSRDWGDVPLKYIYGRVVLRCWPPARWGAVTTATRHD